MATRNAKKSTAQRSSAQRDTSVGTTGGRSSSASVSSAAAASTSVSAGQLLDDSAFVSPHSMTRIGEKDQMIHLNDRLAKYIERVRHLEKENKRLDIHIRELEVVENRDKEAMRDTYERELSELRRLLDETAKRRAELQIVNDRIGAEHDGLLARVKALETDLERALRDLKQEQSMISSMQQRYAGMDADNRRLVDENKKLKKDLLDAGKEKDLAKKQLEEETVMRVDTENRLQSLKEQMKFDKSIHDQIVNEMREKRETEIRMTTRDLQDEFQSKLKERLDEVREQLERSFEAQRRQMEALYNQKLHASSKSAGEQRDELNRVYEQYVTMKAQWETAERDRAGVESQLEAMKKELQRARDSAALARRDADDRASRAEEENRLLRAEMDRMINEYQDLMEIKVKLDMEINTYRALLEEEETRLNLSATPPPAASMHSILASSAQARGAKRRRVALDLTGTQHHADGDEGAQEQLVHDALATRQWDRETRRFHKKEWSELAGITVEHDHQHGDWVRLVNNSDSDLPLNEYQLKQTSDGHTIQYKFHARAKLAPKSAVTVWSTAAEGATHMPPSNLVMKKMQWPYGDKVRAFLADSDEHEVAWVETEATMQHGGVANGREFADGDQRCSIM